MAEREPWLRQVGEGPRAFAVFQSYRDQPPMERSLRRLATMLGRSWRPLAEWSTRWGWVERVAAWDAEQDRLLRAAVAEERKQLGKRLAATGALMQSRGVGKVRSYVERVDRDGYEVALRAGQSYVDEMSIAEATRLVEVGSRLEMLGRGGVSDEPLTAGAASDALAVNVPVPNPIVAAIQRNPPIADEVTDALARLAALSEPDVPDLVPE